MERTQDQYRPQEGISSDGIGHNSINTTGIQDQPLFTDSFAPGHTEARLEDPAGSSPGAGEHRTSRDFSHTDEWDASKVPPSRFQQRKGSIYSTQGSRDGHVQKNKDRDNTFHETHTKLFGKVKEKAKEVAGVGHRRKSSSGSKGERDL